MKGEGRDMGVCGCVCVMTVYRWVDDGIDRSCSTKSDLEGFFRPLLQCGHCDSVDSGEGSGPQAPYTIVGDVGPADGEIMTWHLKIGNKCDN